MIMLNGNCCLKSYLGDRFHISSDIEISDVEGSRSFSVVLYNSINGVGRTRLSRLSPLTNGADDEPQPNLRKMFVQVVTARFIS